jgi:hypothetical protein
MAHDLQPFRRAQFLTGQLRRGHAHHFHRIEVNVNANLQRRPVVLAAKTRDNGRPAVWARPGGIPERHSLGAFRPFYGVDV